MVDADIDAIYDEATKLSDDIAALIPPLTASILDLISCEELPDRCHVSGAFPSPESCLVDDRIDWSPRHLLNAPIPPSVWIGHLELGIKQRIEDGAIPTAIRHPITHGLVLPLWGVAFWSRMSYALDQYDLWYLASETLEDWSAEGIDVGEAKSLMGTVPWGAIVELINESSPIGFLAELLHPGAWLRERHLDLFSIYLTYRAKGHAMNPWIGGVYAAQLLSSERGADADGLAVYGAEIKERKHMHILIPAHVNGNHWILLAADIKKAKVLWGKSSSASCSNTHLLNGD